MSTPAEIGYLSPGNAVHLLLPARELFRAGYGTSTAVAVCGELVTDQTDGEEDPSYCPDCVRAAIQRNAQPPTARGGTS